MRKSRFLLASLALMIILGPLHMPAAGARAQKTQAEEPQKKTAKAPVVLLDPVTQAPRIIRDIEEYAPGAEGGKLRLSQSNVSKVATDYLKKNEARLGVQTANLKLRRARKAGKFWVTTFVQHYQNIPVFRSRIGIVALENGKVVSVGSNFDKSISLNVKPAVAFENAVSIAANSLKLKDSKAVRTQRKELLIFPNPKKEKDRHSLAWRFMLETKKPNAYFFKVFFVDAHKGRILRSHDVLVADNLKAQVKGAIWPEDPTNATENKPFPGLTVKVQDKKDNTGSQGRFQIVGLPGGTYDLSLVLEGPRARVYRNSGTQLDDFVDNEAKLQGSVRTGVEGSLLWPASDEANVFYHLNRVQDWFIDTFDYTYELDWDRELFQRTQIVACCDAGPDVNGLGGNGTVLFGSQSGRQWARGADVIYHEFTHSVLQEIFNGYIGFSDGAYTEGYAMDEGFADFFASALTDDPMHAENISTNPRNLQNNEQYPNGAYNIEGHAGGEIISGACWDFRSSIDEDEADQLVFQALNIMAAWPPDYYFSNPDESNLLSALRIAAGERYQDKIDQAFVNHNLLPEEEPIAPAPLAGPAPKVASITPAHNQRAYGPTQIVITFDREIDATTYTGNIIVEREDYQGRRTVECDLIPDITTKKSITIRPKRNSEGFSPLGMQTNFFVRLVSGGAQSIKGTNGQMLDGDGDGRPGGDYRAKFWVID